MNWVRPVLFVLALSASLAPAQDPGAPGDRQPVRLAQPRIAPLAGAQFSDTQRSLAQKYARSGNGFRTLLNDPRIAEGAMPFTIYASGDSSLAPRHREILILRAAWLCGNEALWSAHASRAKAAGMSAAEVRRIAEGPAAKGWAGVERTLLQLADQLYRNSSITDATWRDLAAAYDTEHLMDAVETVNHYVFLSLLYNSFGVQPEAGSADRLPADVRYRVNVPPREASLAAARIGPVEGTAIAVTRTFSRYPKLNRARAARANFVNRVSPLAPRHREMLILRMGWDCRSEYEWSQHVGRVGRARDYGLDPARIAEGPAWPGWDPFEATLLRAADELYRDAIVSDATWKALGARFDTASLMAAVFTASSYRATSMALNAFGVQHELGDERFPARAAR